MPLKQFLNHRWNKESQRNALEPSNVLEDQATVQVEELIANDTPQEASEYQ